MDGWIYEIADVMRKFPVFVIQFVYSIVRLKECPSCANRDTVVLSDPTIYPPTFSQITEPADQGITCLSDTIIQCNWQTTVQTRHRA